MSEPRADLLGKGQSKTLCYIIWAAEQLPLDKYQEMLNSRWVSEADYKALQDDLKREKKGTQIVETELRRLEGENKKLTLLRKGLTEKDKEIKALKETIRLLKEQGDEAEAFYEGRLSAIQQFRNDKIPEVKRQGDIARNRLKEFYDRLPTIKDASVVIAELQTHIGELIDHIIALHEFEDGLGVLLKKTEGDKQ